MNIYGTRPSVVRYKTAFRQGFRAITSPYKPSQTKQPNDFIMKEDILKVISALMRMEHFGYFENVITCQRYLSRLFSLSHNITLVCSNNIPDWNILNWNWANEMEMNWNNGNAEQKRAWLMLLLRIFILIPQFNDGTTWDRTVGNIAEPRLKKVQINDKWI